MPKSFLQIILPRPPSLRLLPYGILGLGLVLSGGVWRVLMAGDVRAVHLETAGTANSASLAIETLVKARMRTLERKAANWSLRQGIPREEFNADAARVLSDEPGLRAISWVSLDGVVLRSAPLKDERSVIGVDLDHDPIRRQALDAVRATGKPVISRVVRTYTDQTHAFLAVFPVAFGGEPAGFLVAVFEIEGIVRTLKPAHGYQLSIHEESGAAIYQETGPGVWDDAWMASAPLHLGSNIWRLDAVPSVATIRSRETTLPLLGFLVCLLFSGVFTVLVQEILRRRGAENRLRIDLAERNAAERKFRLLFEHNTDAQFLIDDGGIVDCNPSLVRMLGAKDKSEIIGSHPARFSPAVQPDGSPSLPQTDLIGEAIGKQGVARFEWTHCRLDGSPFRAEVTVIAMEFEGRPVQLVSWHDLTERIAAEEKFRVLFEHSKDAHFLVGKNGVLECNPATLRLFGAKDRQSLARLELDFFSDASPAESSAEKTLRRLDGSEFPGLVTRKTVEYQGAKVCLKTVQDLTEQRATQLKLLESSKMSSLGEMAGGIAHELNTPLAVIKGKSDILIELASDPRFTPAELVKQLTVISKMVDRMAAIIRSLRFFARDSGKDATELASVDAILNETLTLCQTRFAHHGVVVERAGASGTEILCRPVQVSQILLNLLGNAFDAMEAQQSKSMTVRVEETADAVLIAVEDNGPGIPPEIRSKIMQPFFTTKDVGKGTGLGLSISLGLAATNGGRLFLDETSAKTRFVLQMPRPPGGVREKAA